MKVIFNSVGDISDPPNMEVEMDIVPQVGDHVYWHGVELKNQYVRAVDWFITHDDEGEPIDAPFVYVVVGPRSPE